MAASEDGIPATVSLGTDEDCSALIGCMDASATNYSEAAIIDGGGCEYPTSENCDEAIALVDGSASGYYGIKFGIH